MRVFITGGTGFVGQEVLDQLHQRNYRSRILARDRNTPQVRKIEAEYKSEVHEGDVLQPGSLRRGLIGMEAVIHLVGIISEVGQSTFENIHLHATQHMLDAAQEAGVRRYVHMSALGTRPNAASRYHQTKWAAEEAVRRSGLDYTIFRPSLIFGPQDHFVNMFARISRVSPVVPIIGKGRARFQPISVQAVGAAFAKSVTEPSAIGQTLDLCGPETLTFEQMLDQVLETLGRKRARLHLPIGLARIQAAILEWVFPKLLHRAPPFNRDQLVMLQEDNLGNRDPANGMFDLPRIPFQEGIASYLRGKARG